MDTTTEQLCKQMREQRTRLFALTAEISRGAKASTGAELDVVSKRLWETLGDTMHSILTNKHLDVATKHEQMRESLDDFFTAFKRHVEWRQEVEEHIRGLPGQPDDHARILARVEEFPEELRHVMGNMIKAGSKAISVCFSEANKIAKSRKPTRRRKRS